MEHNFKKKYGQNFLKDNNILDKIANSVEISNDDLIIEIGPGSGALTEKLIKKSKKLICFEIDTDLKKYLEIYESMGAKIVYGDFLKQNVVEIISEYKYKNLYIIANLPYYITTPVIEKIINDKLLVDNCIFMVQKEVADRLKAKVGTKQYNSLTIFIDYYFEVNKLFDVNRNSFYPKPNVDSTIISLKKRKNYRVTLNNEKIFFKLIRDAFTYKRKTLRNNLKSYNLDIISKVLEKYNLDLNVRAENLNIEIFADISNSLS